MPAYEPSYQRRLRIQAIETWSRDGFSAPRKAFPIEEAFLDRLRKDPAMTAFKPLPMPNIDNVAYQREVSFLIDSFDQFPRRVDASFDSAWKALEACVRDFWQESNVTQCLEALHGELAREPYELLSVIAQNVLQQALEFLVSRWVAPKRDDRLRRRVEHQRPQITALRRHAEDHYELSNPSDLRKVARLTQKACMGSVTLGEVDLRLTQLDVSALIVGGILYGLRNDRFHGSSPSPFTSSEATVKTFVLPYYAFLSSYSIYMNTLVLRGHEELSTTHGDVAENCRANFRSAVNLLGKHWLA